MVRFITFLFTNILNYFVIFVLQGISSENNVDGPISIIRNKHAAFIRHESIHERQKNPPTVNIVVLAPNNDTLPYSLHKVVPGVLYAIQTLKAQGLDSIEGRLIQPIYKDTLCSSTEGPLAAFDFYVSGVVDVFLGPLCTYALAPVARYSAAWNLPLLTVGGQNNNFDAKNPHYRLMTRMNGSFSQIGELFLKLLRKFHWKTVALLFHDFRDQSLGHSNCFFTLGAVFTALGRQSFHVAFDETKPEERDFYRLLWDISTKARIILVCGSPDTVREILLAAEDLHMVQNGDYVFFSIELFTSKNKTQKPWFREEDLPEINDRARKAFDSLLTVTAPIPNSQEFSEFSKQVQNIAKKKFGFDYGTEEVNTFVTSIYEAVLLYVLAASEILKEGKNITNGTAITHKMWNRTFEGITGNVSINSNGDRDADYALMDMNPDTGIFEIVAMYYGATKQFVDIEGKEIHWPGGHQGPPPDTPSCGFDGSECPETPRYAIFTGILTALLIVLTIISLFIYRHYKFEAEIASMSWRIKQEEIVLNPSFKRHFDSKMSFTKISGSNSLSCGSLTLGDQSRQIFTKTAYYKSTLVAIKPVKKSKIEINRQFMLEIKKVKSLQHHHIARFIGACVDSPVPFLITEYCPKGSLLDILENDQIALDWMFRYSLTHDIIKGMAYLHGSEVRCHGNLKSSNCVVDSRFVLKITDFGLHSLRVYEENVDFYDYWRKQLWTAPELLRMPNQLNEGTQKGDIYAFAIIAHEIVVREGPFYLGIPDVSPKEIVENVKHGQKPPFRPYLEEDMCNKEIEEMIRRCWAEDPTERPDFQALKSVIRKLNKDNESGNILDNLLSRMEQYANNLETLVEERTADYLEEKRKAEDLLYQLLPRSVASQLIRGESVTAEAFDTVTIYFSDIVGFTELSAESTPMQVETIGDAYMVVSGLPVRNGTFHAREIARMSIALLNTVMSFTIRHRTNEQLKLRIGIHSGPCAAGVVGLKMPRYCLFGDTVNTASRMESTGLPLKIHVSSQTKEILNNFGSFRLELRGEVEMKGKGKVTTYWLLEEENTANSAEQTTVPNSKDNKQYSKT
ncbi:atrial natriuretic peptide receptor 1-like isoform X2 [Tachypleus tridentatus]|uniref:atrial natriuretic peptide receptor 1-like isoform X2 n=1 Tax=Tachypleus tridentatus TaxID=6853 RepID=UPI003FCF55DA